MRIFLIVIAFVNTMLYLLVYAYYENIMGLFGNVNVAGGWLSFLKILDLVIVGFLIGLIVAMLLRLRIEKSFFDYRMLLIVGILPFIFLILSQGQVTNFFITKLFNSNRQISEAAFYFFSSQIIWAMWFGFAIGVSIRLAFKKKL
ncbi:MAG: hypothetical protein IMZ70_02650, partial [Candidatus Atribacteria bacterium]|nr:hypothetical protein [Candidatus Atribacteria bacterium]